MTTPIRILACDGGGIRGLLTTLILEDLEARVQRLKPGASLASCFDVFAGTSTGSIIACGLANGFSAAKIRRFYEQRGAAIFPEMDAAFWVGEVLERAMRGHLSLPLFRPNGLEQVLRSDDVFPDSLLFGQLSKETLVVSYDTFNRKAVVFKSRDHKSATIPVWQVCRASSAAPVAFPGFQLDNEHFLKTHFEGGNVEGDLVRMIPANGLPLIDGGVLANNPVLCAIAEQVNKICKECQPTQENPLQRLQVASFGTGQPGGRISPDNVETWGALAWADLVRGVPLYQVCADGSADVIDYVAASLLGSSYQRFQPVLWDKTTGEEVSISTFQADGATMQRIRDVAARYIADPQESERLQKLAETITKP